MKVHGPFIMSRCPACAAPVPVAQQHNPAGDPSPEPGDLTVCIECLASLIFRADLSVRVLSAEEWEALPDLVREAMDRTRYRLQRVHAQLREDAFNDHPPADPH